MEPRESLETYQRASKRKKDSPTPKAVVPVITAFDYQSFEVTQQDLQDHHKRFPQCRTDKFLLSRLSREDFRISRGSC
jgi:hypothetical protein